MDLLIKVRNFIREQHLLQDNDRVLVGFSGGSDSVALLSVLLELGYKCLAVHVNFQLRGEEALRDEAFAAAFCRERSLPFLLERVDTRAYAKNKGISIEMAARELRYQYFQSLLSQDKADKVAVGHHIDDSIETFFINLLRGSGIRGLQGISPQRDRVIRPLLCVNRQEILSWLKRKGLNYVNDSTNDTKLYRRNQIRHQVLPLLREIEPSAMEAIQRSMQHLAAPAALYEQEIAQAMERLKLKSPESGQNLSMEKSRRESESYLSLKVADLEKEALAADILYEWLSDYGFDFRSVARIWAKRGAQTGKRYYSADYCLLFDRGHFLLSKIKHIDNKVYTLEEGVYSWTKPVALTLSIWEAGRELPRSADYACLDADKLQFPLHLRRALPGDRFMPLGMQGTKLLSDYFCDRKKNQFQKASTWLLISGEDIVWLLGERIDQRYRVSDSTRRIYCFSLSESV